MRYNVIHVEIVLVVALIAISRKVIVLDLAKYDSVTVLAIAALIIALALGFVLVRQARIGWTLPKGQSPGAPGSAE